jgi:glycosyltransferase involved in cell wall biosynthesis
VSSSSILVAPAHYTLADSVGSEPYIAFKIIDEVSKMNTNIRITAITGYNLITPASAKEMLRRYNIKIVNLYEGSPQFSDLRKLKFYLDLYLYINKYNLVKSADIVHHMFPFGYRMTFNLLYRLANKYKRPFIIGPVQSPQLFVGRDEFVGEKFVRKKPPLYSVEPLRKTLAPIFHELFKRTVRSATILVAATMFAKKLYENYVDSERIVVIPFGVDSNSIKVKRGGVENGKIRIMYAGSITMRKGLSYLLRAFAKVARSYRDVELHIYGKGPQLPHLRSLALKLGISDKVVFHGFVPRRKLIEKYSEHDIYVHPSLSESFGVAVLEAMAAGLPVVASNIPNLNEIIVHGKTGFLFKPKDVEDLAEHISILIENDKLRRIIGLKAREHVLKHYDWKVIALKWLEVYKHAIELA